MTLPLQESDFVFAARCGGHSTLSLVGRHIIPNTLVPVFSQFSLSCAYAVQMVAGLSFIGLGVRVPQPEWGSMISLGRASSSLANGGRRFSPGWPSFSRPILSTRWVTACAG